MPVEFTITDTQPTQWTDGAVFCYERGCTCEGCYIKDIIEEKCQMKMAVIKLVRELGAPKEKRYGVQLTQTQEKILEAICQGKETYQEIADFVGNHADSTRSTLSLLYDLAEADGVIYTNLRNKFPQFKEWVRSKYVETRYI